jgi:hypothetical protein
MPQPSALPIAESAMTTGKVTIHCTVAPRGSSRRRSTGIVVAARPAMITDWMSACRSVTAIECVWPDAAKSTVSTTAVVTQTAATRSQ